MAESPSTEATRARLENNLDEASKSTRGIFYLYLGALAYCFLTVVETSDRQLLLGDRTQLPIVNIQVPLYGFFLMAPLLLVFYFAYFQFYLLKMKDLKDELKKSGGLERLNVNPWMIHLAEDSDPGFIGWLQKSVAGGVLWLTLPIILSVFYVAILKRHDPFLSRVLFWESLGGSIVVYFFWRLFQDKFGSRHLRFILILVLLFFGSHLIVGPLWPHLFFGKFTQESFDPRNFDLSFQKLIQEDNEKYSELPLVYLKGKDLRWANMQSTVLIRADLREAHLENANLDRASLNEAWLYDARMEGSSLVFAALDSANLSNTNLDHADLSETMLEHALLFNAKLDSANLSQAHLPYALLSGASLQGADLSSAFLDSTGLGMTNLQHANLSNAYLGGAWLTGANLRYANLDSANLTDANFDSADLSNADIQGADLRSAVVTLEQLSSARTIYQSTLDPELLKQILPGTKLWHSLNDEPK